MKLSKKDLRPALAKAQGLGSAKSGTTHFWLQRITAIANLILFFIFLLLGVSYMGKGYETAHHLLACPVIALLCLAMIVCGIYHMMLGCQVIIEDYISCHFARSAVLIANKFGCYLLIFACVMSVLKINFGV